ncbi:hypothetical protein [Nocardioides montaniterrae]
MAALLDREDVERDLGVSESLGLTLTEFDSLRPIERRLRIARWARKRETCSDCGRPISECSDPRPNRYAYRLICYRTMEAAAAQAAYDDLHRKAAFHDGTFTNWGEKRSPEHPYAHNDGVTIGVADEDLMPWDAFTTKVDASPIPHEPPAGEREIHDGEHAAEE